MVSARRGEAQGRGGAEGGRDEAQDGRGEAQGGRGEAPGGRDEILAVARRLESDGSYLFFKHGARFHDPLVPAQWAALRGEPALDDAVVRRVVLEELPARRHTLARGIYSPVPIARGLEAKRPIDDLLDEFRYEMIRVDAEQRWMWMGRPVAARIKSFFLENLAWEPAIGRWLFEYQVNPDWWDKSYLDAEVTPLLALAVRERQGALVATLNSGASERLDLDTLRLDQRERLFCRGERLGEVLLADSVRFSILRHANEACDAVLIGGRWRQLHWPPDVSG
jgi:hypothetical protein